MLDAFRRNPAIFALWPLINSPISCDPWGSGEKLPGCRRKALRASSLRRKAGGEEFKVRNGEGGIPNGVVICFRTLTSDLSPLRSSCSRYRHNVYTIIHDDPLDCRRGGRKSSPRDSASHVAASLWNNLAKNARAARLSDTRRLGIRFSLAICGSYRLFQSGGAELIGRSDPCHPRPSAAKNPAFLPWHSTPLTRNSFVRIARPFPFLRRRASMPRFHVLI